MNRETLLGLYDRLTFLIGKLPGGLQKPILRELVPIRELFLEQRPARLLLLGHPQPSADAFLAALVAAGGRSRLSGGRSKSAPHADPDGLPRSAPALEIGAADHGWRLFQANKRAAVEVLDARGGDLPADWLERGLSRCQPDVILVFHDPACTDEATFEHAAAAAAAASNATPATAPGTVFVPAVVGVSCGDASGVERLRAMLLARRELSGQNLRVLALTEAAEIGRAVCAFLPNPARLEFALFCDLRDAQAEIARSLLKSFTAVCGVIGMQPIPLADLPVLATLQSLMAGLIAYTSGRRLGPKAITEFFAAVGVSIGAGMLFREGARALVKIVPIWGNAVSGLVAGAGTYAIGRAAIAYFIEDLPATEARKLFRMLLPKKGAFRKPNTPRLPE